MARMTPVDRGNREGVNPYGQDKVWADEGKTGKAFVSADDSMAYVSTPKYAMINTSGTQEEQPEQPATDPSLEQDQKYQKVDWKKRYDDGKRYIDTLKSQIKELETKLKEPVQAYKPPSSAEDLDTFKRNNPDLYNFVETLAYQRSTAETQALKEQLESVRNQLAYTEAEKAYAALKSQVPDYDQIRQSDDFHEWAETQPKEIQDWIYNNSTNVDLAVRAIRLYKAEVGAAQPVTTQPVPSVHQPVQPAQVRRADEYIPSRASQDEPTPKDRVWRTSEISRLSSKQYEQYRDEIDRAFMDGRVVRDTK